MKALILILMSLFFVSCASVKKFGVERHFAQRTIDINSEAHEELIQYWTTTENDQHCFESNPKNKEIITVSENYQNYAIEHFYVRLVKVDVVIQRPGDSRPRILAIVTDDAHFKLEKAYCSITMTGNMFRDFHANYVSFRLAD